MTRPSGRVRSSRPLRGDTLGQPAHLRFDIDRAELAALGEMADKLGGGRPLGEKFVGQVEQLLEIAVPRGQPQFGIEHRDAVAHVVEGDAQLGLALADLAEQPRILHRDDRLRREILQQRDLLVGEGPDLLAIDG